MSSKITLPALALALPLFLAACSAPDARHDEMTNGAFLPSPRAIVDQIQYEVPFASASEDPSGASLAGLSLFLDANRVQPGDRFHVVAPSGADPKLTRQRVKAVARALADKGLRVTAPTNSIGLTPAAPDTLSVVVRRYSVKLPDCPNWSDPLIGKWSNRSHSNFGCATASNLGLMVEDPHDLVGGRDLGPLDGDFAVRTSQDYINGEVEVPAVNSITGFGE